MIILDIVFSYINLRNIIIPVIVNSELISDNNEKNCWSKPKISISNQPIPAPTPGTALNINTIMAVPIIVFLIVGDIFFNRFFIK